MVRGWIFGVVTALALGLVTCGGNDPQPRTVDWQAQERVPQSAEHWWAQDVERRCSTNADCRSNETCELMRLGTCESCPRSGGGYSRGQDARICVPREGASAER